MQSPHQSGLFSAPRAENFLQHGIVPTFGDTSKRPSLRWLDDLTVMSK